MAELKLPVREATRDNGIIVDDDGIAVCWVKRGAGTVQTIVAALNATSPQAREQADLAYQTGVADGIGTREYVESSPPSCGCRAVVQTVQDGIRDSTAPLYGQRDLLTILDSLVARLPAQPKEGLK